MNKITMRPEIVYTLKAIKRDAQGNEISSRESAPQHNVFTNYGVEAIFGNTTGDNVANLAGVVGTGSSTPVVTQSVLDAFLAGAYTGNPTNANARRGTLVDNGDGTGYVETVWISVFAVGVATGNISEVGSAFRATVPGASTPLCSRALVLDGGGTPTTFEVLADEELQLNQYFRRHIRLADQTAVLSENGNNHTITWRPRGVTPAANFWDFPGGIGSSSQNATIGNGASGTPVVTLVAVDNTANPTVTGVVSPAYSNSSDPNVAFGERAYVANSKKMRVFQQFKTGSNRIIYSGSFGLANLGTYQFKIEPHIDKSALQRYTLDFEFVLDNTP